jgi:hypothetical protein
MKLRPLHACPWFPLNRRLPARSPDEVLRNIILQGWKGAWMPCERDSAD